MTQKGLHKLDFHHSQWLDTLSHYWETAQAFFSEAWETVKILSKKGFSRAIKEVKFFISKSTLMDYICGGLSAFMGFLATLVFLSGFGLLGYQLFLWLKDGVWTEYPLFVVFNFLFENTVLHEWTQHPESWVGLQKLTTWILENTPLSLALIVPGFIGASMIAGVMVTAVMIRYYQFKKTEEN